jgi:large subunit ribosomal protein L23
MQTLVQRPVITEKSLMLVPKGWYTFAVSAAARKEQIAAEIAKLYNVKVVAVRTIRMHGKTRRVGRKMSTIARPDWKKALVQLKSGQKIDVFEVGAMQPEAATAE